MNESSVLCIAVHEGVDCRAEATMLDPVPLCDEDQLRIALHVVPDVLVAAFRQAGSGLKPAALAPAERAAVIAGASPRPVSAHMGGAHAPVVYFGDAGERVKIGFSTNLRNRIRSLSLQEKDVILLLQGGLTLERALQDSFAKERIDSTEWFAKSDRLMTFIQSKQADLGTQQQRKVRHQYRKHTVVPAASVPVGRGERVKIVRGLIDGVGGNPADLPLRTIQERFSVSQATASRIRAEASKREA